MATGSAAVPGRLVVGSERRARSGLAIKALPWAMASARPEVDGIGGVDDDLILE
jgi:hypothetical protein